MGSIDPKALWQLFDYCFNHNPSAISCESFWSYSILGFIGFGVALLIFGVTKIVSYQRKLRAAYVAEWERNSIDEAGIREAKWKGDDQTPGEPDAEVVHQIRAALAQRKADQQLHP